MTTRFDRWQDGEVLDELDENGYDLTPWEIGFVEDVSQHLKRDVDLSKEQKAKLRQIADQRLP